MSEDIINLRSEFLETKNNENSHCYNLDQVFYEIFCKESFPANAANFKIENTECQAGSISEFYKITHS